MNNWIGPITLGAASILVTPAPVHAQLSEVETLDTCAVVLAVGDVPGGPSHKALMVKLRAAKPEITATEHDTINQGKAAKLVAALKIGRLKASDVKDVARHCTTKFAVPLPPQAFARIDAAAIPAPAPAVPAKAPAPATAAVQAIAAAPATLSPADRKRREDAYKAVANKMSTANSYLQFGIASWSRYTDPNLPRWTRCGNLHQHNLDIGVAEKALVEAEQIARDNGLDPDTIAKINENRRRTTDRLIVGMRHANGGC